MFHTVYYSIDSVVSSAKVKCHNLYSMEGDKESNNYNKTCKIITIKPVKIITIKPAIKRSKQWGLDRLESKDLISSIRKEFARLLSLELSW